MPHVITQSCCSDGSCVYACPVNCIHPSPDEPGFATAEMLYIDPVACVDCGACVSACPVHLDRPARHRGQQVPVQGRRSVAPLDKRGRAQAESLVGQLLAFGADTLYAADRVRCQQTLEPLAEELGVAIHNEPLLTEEAYADDRKPARRRILEIAAAGGTPVICTQGKVIPDLIAWWCERDGVRPDKSRNRKGSTWVMSSWQGHLVAADHIGSPLATKK